MKPLLKIKDPAEFSSGLWPDRPDNQVALWKDGENILFQDGKIYSRGQIVPVWSAGLGSVSALAQAYTGKKRRVYFGSTAGIHYLEEPSNIPTLIAADVNPAALWSLQPYGTFLLATNGQSTPKIWENGGALINWPTVPFATADLVKKLEVFPVLFRGQEAAWPAFNDYKNFVPAPGNRAGQFFIRDLDGEVVAAEPLRNSLVYYTQNMFGFMSFVGGELSMSFTPGGVGIGAVGPNAVCVTGFYHYGMSRKGIWRSDGTTYEYIAPPKIIEWIQARIDYSGKNPVVAFANERESLIEFYFKDALGMPYGVAFSFEGPTIGNWTILTEDVTAASSKGGYEYPIVASFGLVGYQRNNPADTGFKLNTFPLDAGQPDLKKRWQNLQLTSIIPDSIFQARVGFSDNYGEEPDWTAWQSTTGSDVWFDRESIFITVQIRSAAGAVGPLGLSGIEVFGVGTGRKR